MNEWKECKLGDVAHVIPGFAFKSAHFGQTGHPVIRISDIDPPYVDLESAQKVDLSFYDIEKLHKYFLRKNEFVVAMTGATIGKIGRNIANEPAILNQRVAKISPKDSVDYWFIYYCIQGNSFQDFIQNNIDSHSAQENISGTSIERFPILLPPLAEQRAIGSILSSLDDKIDLLYHQNKTLESLAESLWRKMFVEDADSNRKQGKLGDLLKSIETGRRPKGGIDQNMTTGIPSIGAESIDGLGNYEYSKTKYITEDYYQQMKNGKIQDYDILIYKDGAYIGKKSMFANGFPFNKCCVNEHVFILRTENIHLQLFLYFVLRQDELEQLNANSAQPGLNQEAIKSFELFVPSTDVINEFGIEAKSFVDKVFRNSVQIRVLEKLRDSLLPKLMSGEVSVKNGRYF